MSSPSEEEKEFRHLTAEVAQDAYDSWNMLAARLDMLPDGAKQYFERVCAMVNEFDPHEDSELVFSKHLEDVEIRSKLDLGKSKPLAGKSKHDFGFIFDWVTNHHQKRNVSLEEAFELYVEEFDLRPEEFETVRLAYMRVRRVRLESMDQTKASI